jgi:hypothetical protein
MDFLDHPLLDRLPVESMSKLLSPIHAQIHKAHNHAASAEAAFEAVSGAVLEDQNPLMFETAFLLQLERVDNVNRIPVAETRLLRLENE